MLNAGLTPAAVASAVGVDAKTVGRWLAGESTPYPLTRVRLAQILGYDETFLWPSLVTEAEPDGVPGCRRSDRQGVAGPPHYLE